MKETKQQFPERLFACWHPVGYSNEINAKEPFGTFLLDEAIVIWRTSDGSPHAMRDLCIHRGTALSLGWIKDDCLVCPYHAWEYNKMGSCVKIPQAPDKDIPIKAKTPTYHCQEKFGIVWVSLKEPEFDLPDIPEYENITIVMALADIEDDRPIIEQAELITNYTSEEEVLWTKHTNVYKNIVRRK